MNKEDPVVSMELKRMSRDQLLTLSSASESAGFSGRRSAAWIQSKVGAGDSLVVRPLLWEDSPNRCLRCSVVFVDREHGLGQLLLDVSEEDFDRLPSVAADNLRDLAIHLVDHVKILPPMLSEGTASH